ncbi:MAG: AbrB/MazE/SpoVT family DNA-binding domain-containing protein [Monoglobales bacterium]|jgi:hypothetical protein|nr:MAG TPA: ribonuclease [Caudoviricetes sp.]
MEEKKLKIILNKSGNGNINPRCPIPIDWFRKLGFTEQEVEANARLEEIDGKYKLVIEK